MLDARNNSNHPKERKSEIDQKESVEVKINLKAISDVISAHYTGLFQKIMNFLV